MESSKIIDEVNLFRNRPTSQMFTENEPLHSYFSIFSLLSGNVCFERILWPAGSTRLPLPKSCMKKIHMQENTQKKSCRKIYLMKTCTLIFLLLDWIISICTATYLQLKYWKIIRWAATNYCWLLYHHMTALSVKRYVYFRQFAR